MSAVWDSASVIDTGVAVHSGMHNGFKEWLVFFVEWTVNKNVEVEAP